jgi:hypothetical protein
VTTPVTEEGAEKVESARRVLALGVALIWLSVLIAVFS